MAWVKLDDSMPMHPKLLAAGVEAFALDVAGIAYSNRFNLDGKISDMILPAVLPNLENPELVAARLVEVGRWKRLKTGWKIHDYLEFQPSKAHKREVSEKRAEAGRVGGSRPKPQANIKHNASTASNPVPSRPVHDDETSSSLREFNNRRALAETTKEAKTGTIRNPEALATWKAKQVVFRQESQRLWNHRDCKACGGKGFQTFHPQAGGSTQAPCSEAV